MQSTSNISPPPVLTGLPVSLSSQIDQLNRIVSQSGEAMAQGDPELALVRAKQGLKVLQVLAQSAPELGALLAAASQGHAGYLTETFEQSESSVVNELRVFGIKVASSTTHNPKTTRVIRQFRVI